MDVRISYGINIDEVPSKLVNLLHSADSVNGDASGAISLAINILMSSDDNIEMAEKIIEQARTKLASVDRVLNDAQMIMAGYVRAKQETPPTPVAPESPNAG